MTDREWLASDIQTEFGNFTSMEEVIKHLESLALQSGEVVCEIRINDHLIDESELITAQQFNADQIQSIRMKSSRPDRLILTAMRSAIEFIPLLVQSSSEAALLFRDAELKMAHYKIKEVVEGCQWLVETLTHVRSAGQALGHLSLNSNSDRWFVIENLMRKTLAEIIDAFERQDYILLADLLEVEMTGVIEAWSPVLQTQLQEFSNL